MKNFKDDFMSFEGRVWLNAASEGPLPKVAAKALEEAIVWKSRPYELTINKFISVPLELKKSIACLINVDPRDVILGNSASYGLHILANGIRWECGDEILLMQNDFPTNILPWLALEKKGVKVSQLKPKDQVLTPDEIIQEITSKTKLLCLSHVHTFTGAVLDVDRIGQICKENRIVFVVNLSQSLGTMPVEMDRMQASACVTAGYKWLCGPYGTGFCWMKPELREQLELNRSYWISQLTEEDLTGNQPLVFRENRSARKYDVFGTANFFNFVPFKASIDYFLNIGMKNVQEIQNSLVEYFHKSLDSSHYNLVSPQQKSDRSSLIVFSRNNPKLNEQIHQYLLEKNIYTALWKDNIRIAPHIYNDKKDIDGLIAALKLFHREDVAGA